MSADILLWSATSGIALESPPAPTSCIKIIGFEVSLDFSMSIVKHRVMTSCALLSSSALSLWTDAKSNSLSLLPAFRDDADPPPNPISIAGPPRTIINDPGSISFLFTADSEIFPIPPTIIIGL